jgi:hypothetical protein
VSIFRLWQCIIFLVHLCIGSPFSLPALSSFSDALHSSARVQVLLSSDFQHVHLLHGVLHANGFGHLCRVNGREGGASTLTGTQLMHAWDRLCKLLRARLVSVEDVSNKLTLELRVLHAIAYGKTWYGRWDYTHGRGPFNTSAADWATAASTAAKTPLHALQDASGKRRRKTVGVGTVLARYADGGGGSAGLLGGALSRVFEYIRDPEKARPLLVAASGGQRARLEAPAGAESPQEAIVGPDSRHPTGMEGAGSSSRPLKRQHTRKKSMAEGKPISDTPFKRALQPC